MVGCLKVSPGTLVYKLTYHPTHITRSPAAPASCPVSSLQPTLRQAPPTARVTIELHRANTVRTQIDDARSFALEFSKVKIQTIKLSGKSEALISVNYNYDEFLTFGGTFEPAFLLNVVISLGNINSQANIKYSKALFGFFGEKLGIKDDRGYISFIDPGWENLG
ncbi:Tautomerase/MIF superfamily [Phellopilus nigrolimitatus]|nr:Tautomerase/MIF superfamily [Phellopilus nigrolimitatus]